MKKIAVSKLKNWADNPRDLTESAYNQLINQLRLGEIENLLVLKDGTVLNGNMRLRAYKEVGKEEATVAELEFVATEDGRYHVMVDGELAIRQDEGHKGQPTTFDSVEQGMLHYAIAGNVHVGVFNEDLIEQISLVEITPDMFQLHMSPGTRVEDLILGVGPLPKLPTGVGEDEDGYDVNPLAAKLDTYENGTIKQITIYFSNSQYLEVLPRIEDLMKKTGSKNNTELILAALDALEASL